MAVVTPGIDFLARNLAYFGALVGILIYLKSIVTTSTDYAISTPLLVLGLLLGLPILATARILASRFSQRRQAAAFGARMVPAVHGSLPGNIDVLKKQLNKNKYPGDGLIEYTKTIGPIFNFRAMWNDMIFTTSPEHIKSILATDFKNFVKGERFQRNFSPVLGTGVFNSDGEMWKFHRSITRPMFTRERISHFDLFDRHAAQALSKLAERLREGHAVDFQDLMSRFTLDSATEFLFGNCVESLSSGLPYPSNLRFPPALPRSARGDTANAFATAFSEAQEAVSTREMSRWIWPLFEIWKDKVHGPMQIVNAYIEPIVREALEKKRNTPPKDKDDDADDGTLLDHLVGVTEDPAVLKDEILNIMIAGRDTTASTLSFIVYFLAMYPNVFSRLREEIMEKVGPSRRPTYEDIKDMKYLRSVINETLRLYPVVPFNIRTTVDATTWVSEDPTAKPYFIPAGTKIGYSVFMMHRRPELWGPDAEEFDPDRFLDERLKKYISKNPFIFLPFNAGPRICLGQQFAYNEMSFMIIRLLQRFKNITLDLDAAPVESRPPAAWSQDKTSRKRYEQIFPKMHLTLYAAGGLWVKMEEDG